MMKLVGIPITLITDIRLKHECKIFMIYMLLFIAPFIYLLYKITPDDEANCFYYQLDNFKTDFFFDLYLSSNLSR